MLHRRRAPYLAGLAAMSVALAISQAGPAVAQTGSPPPAAASATPSSADPFAVSGVKVDISGNNPTTIRDQAIREAQSKAWAELYRRLVPGAGNPPRLSDNEVARLVQGFEIDEEKVSATRYLGSITVRFRPNAVRDALGQSGGTAQYVEPPSRPFVLLPVTTTDGRTILWEDRTPWREAWEARQPAASLVPLVVPDGELADAQAMGAEDAVSGNADAVTRMAQRYKAGGVVVARTELPANGPDPARGLTVDVTRYGLDGTHESQTVQVKGGGTAGELLARAVAAVSGQLDESWRSEHTTPTGPEQTTLVRVPLSAVNDWVETRKRLAAVNAVSRTVLVSMSRTEALVNLTYRGGPDQLAQTLVRSDLSLTRAAGAVPMQGAYPGAPVPVPAPVPVADWQLTLMPKGSGATAPAAAPSALAPSAPSALAPSAPMGTAPAYGGPATGGTVMGAPPRNLGTLPTKGVP